MMCCYCEAHAKRHGRDRGGNQRFRCRNCNRTFLEEREKPLGDMRIPQDKAVIALKMLAEGSGLRSISRLTGLHRDTICRLLVHVGKQCERFMEERIFNVPVQDVQVDELWGFVGMKKRTKSKLGIENPLVGDAYVFIGIERNSKLILSWHLGERNKEHAVQFLNKLNLVTANRFQISTDAWKGYGETVTQCLGAKADYGSAEKHYAEWATREENRFAGSHVVSVKKRVHFGNPDWKKICTSHIERANLTIRHFVKRLARMTPCFSKKWENLKAALAWHFCFYNFCWVHGSLKATPAMQSHLTDHVWTVEEVLTATL